jgi:DNA-binding NtrC family response regulator
LIFVVDDEPHLRGLFQAQLELEGFQVLALASGEECLQSLDRNPSVVCLDMMMTGMNGLETLKKIKLFNKNIPVIMVTSQDSVNTVVEAMKLGAYDYIAKPVDKMRLVATVRKALEQNSLFRQVEQLQTELQKTFSYQNIIGKSASMNKVFAQIDKVKESSINVFIHGETGTGKELVARAIHYSSCGGERPFVDINCGAIPESLQESELFGHEKGSFTGAIESRKGRLELADGGTLFLDEVAEMNLSAQVKLLRFLQEKSFERVGGTKKISVNLRVISATNKNLENEVKEKRFREDLYYRLMVYPIALPPLRERKEDIPLLCAHFLKKYRGDFNKEIKTVTPEAMEMFYNSDWPGNVRQLENTIHRAMVSADGDSIGIDCLPKDVFQKIAPQERQSDFASLARGKETLITLDEAEKHAILMALKIAGGNVVLAAQKLGLSRATFYRKIKKHGLSDSGTTR